MASTKLVNNTKPYYFEADDDNNSSDADDYDSDTALPFPKPLDRSKFLDASFSAAEFLSTLQNRFQTLEDLQAELQDLVRNLNRELIDLVNDNYTDFLSLGEKLRGGEERIEEVHVGLLGFQRDVTGVRDLVAERSGEVRRLLGEKRQLRKDIRTGRTLLEVDERLHDLEGRVGLARPPLEKAGKDIVEDKEHTQLGDFSDWDESWTAEPDLDNLDDLDSVTGDDNEAASGRTQQDRDIPRRLSRNLEQMKIIQHLSRRCTVEDGKDHPFILAQRDRVSQIKDILRRDLEAAVRSQPNVQAKQRIIRMRSELDDE